MNLNGSPSQELSEILEILSAMLQPTEVQYDTAKAHYLDVGKWLAEKSDLASLNPDIFPHGSFAIGTVNKPLRYEEYDVDLILLLRLMKDGRNPGEVLRDFEKTIRKKPGVKTELLRRCVRLHYPGFHLDALAAFPDSSGGTRIWVPDRKLETWKPSNPKGYIAWFESRATIKVLKMQKGVEALPEKEPPEFKTNLQRSAQILKRWRDVMWKGDDENAPVSIVLTTLAGLHYRPRATIYEVVSVTLDGIVASISDEAKPLRVLNPVDEAEVLSEKWDRDPKSYRAFVNGIISFKEKWRDLRNISGLDKIGDALESLLGEKLPATAIEKFVERRREARERRELGMKRPTGQLIIGATALPSVVPVRRHTFYGDK